MHIPACTYYINYILAYNYLHTQKQSPGGVLRKRCSEQFRTIHRKTTLPESLFNKVAGLRLATLMKKRPWHRCFRMNFAKYLRTLF